MRSNLPGPKHSKNCPAARSGRCLASRPLGRDLPGKHFTETVIDLYGKHVCGWLSVADASMRTPVPALGSNTCWPDARSASAAICAAGGPGVGNSWGP